ncbi:SDR family NAD(P)-dependent oxidoreductase [Chelativorans alearense]|uniref:SDR family NAD(P)-dependent oxidoreductase n=1 Tax=Chelativorans alearense TaxID=2681495 RepID=UPI0013D26E1C|nr:SDR family oxidoreductase [Chelativorans alearense]
MDLELEGKTALVTGGSAGLGRAIAAGLAGEGVRLCIAARRPEMLEDAAGELAAISGKRPVLVQADMMEKGAAVRLAEEAIRGLGHVDILVNSAGVGRPVKLDTPEETWDEVIMMNFTSRRQLIQALLPRMMERGWGRIINITGGSEPTKINAGFSGKAALQAWCKGVSREVGKHGITINAVAPGRLLSEQAYRRYTEEERAAFAAKEVPVGRLGYPGELANVAVFLASPKASYVTGAVVPVDGGMRRYAF